jgi:DNA repair exonuclease SbcCD ATPase subunit/DNA repair exonuclease SbcCD nuclease subunit
LPKFAHIADTHIKNLKYHYEYKIVFDKLYTILREEKPDYIIHCGDIAHTKTQISPEFVEMCSDFFSNLANIAPTYVILGNHDGNLKNSNRQDALTPIADALAHPNLHLLKNSGETLLGANVALNVLSVFDEEGWVEPSDPSKINIALYHGSVSGVKTDTGWVMTHGEHPIEIFEGHDYGFLGDIHKTNQKLDEEGRIRYCGSTIQQNHGETNDKGFLLWEIQDKENFSCRHIELKNPRPFVTIELTSTGKMPRNASKIVPKDSRLRLVSNNNLPIDVMRKATEVAKRRFKPESITFLNRATGQRGNVQGITDGLETEDLRNIEIQEELIKEYLKDFEVDDDLMKRVLDLNLKYNKIAEENEEVSRNINWRLRSIEWDNLFNYGEENSINFDNLEGIVGIFGKNFSGKSSIIDSILYTIFNSTSKNDRKNLNIINQNRDFGKGRVKISIGDTDYYVDRSSEKYTRKLKGEVTQEAKTNVDFNMYDPNFGDTESLNGLTRNQTDKNIRKVFGTLEDFLYSSMASQMDSLTFIKEGSTKRKEILAKFLDLEFFERKFKLSKDDASDTKGALRKSEGRDFNSEILEAEEDLEDANNKLEKKKSSCESIKLKMAECGTQISEINEKIKSIPAEIIDVLKVQQDLLDKKNQLISVSDQNEEFQKNRDDDRTTYQRVVDFLGDFDVESLFNKQECANDLLDQIASLENLLSSEEEELVRNRNKEKLLSGIPCGHAYPKCKFIKDAYVSKATIPLNEKEVENLSEQIDDLAEEVQEINPDQVDDHISKYNALVDRRNELSNKITNYDLKIEKNSNLIKSLIREVEEIEGKVSEYELNKEVIENLENLTKNLRTLKIKSQNLQGNFNSCNTSMLSLYKTVGSLEQKVDNLATQRGEFLDLQEEFSAYDLYMRCMHPNGIAYDVIRRKLPVINEEIAKILANIVEFEVFFEDDGKRLDIFIKHPRHEPRPLEMGSGAEKTIAAMAIRLALLSVSSLPKSDIFILDEPGTALDEENMQGFIDILDLIRSYFKTVLLISHLDSLKDCVDMQITIDKKNGYAFIQQ